MCKQHDFEGSEVVSLVWVLSQYDCKSQQIFEMFFSQGSGVGVKGLGEIYLLLMQKTRFEDLGSLPSTQVG